jgi:hypothetical protein
MRLCLASAANAPLKELVERNPTGFNWLVEPSENRLGSCRSNFLWLDLRLLIGHNDRVQTAQVGDALVILQLVVLVLVKQSEGDVNLITFAAGEQQRETEEHFVEINDTVTVLIEHDEEPSAEIVELLTVQIPLLPELVDDLLQASLESLSTEEPRATVRSEDIDRVEQVDVLDTKRCPGTSELGDVCSRPHSVLEPIQFAIALGLLLLNCLHLFLLLLSVDGSVPATLVPVLELVDGDVAVAVDVDLAEDLLSGDLGEVCWALTDFLLHAGVG